VLPSFPRTPTTTICCVLKGGYPGVTVTSSDVTSDGYGVASNSFGVMVSPVGVPEYYERFMLSTIDGWRYMLGVRSRGVLMTVCCSVLQCIAVYCRVSQCKSGVDGGCDMLGVRSRGVLSKALQVTVMLLQDIVDKEHK
jgi:hypothetical protein